MDTKKFGKALLWYAKQNGINDIGVLKLQKLSYYCQGYSLAMHGEPIFEDRVLAYNYGPVSPVLYGEYKKMTLIDDSLFSGGDIIFANMKDKFKFVIEYVVQQLGSFSSNFLITKTHNETPWLNHSTGYNKANSKEISHDELKAFFTLELAKKQDEYFVKLLDSLEGSNNSVAIPKKQTEDEFLSFINSL